MLHWLGLVAREAREAAGRHQVHIAVRVPGKKPADQATIGRFEAGKAWPRNPSRTIAAYAEDLEIDPFDLWEEAVRRWRQERDATP